MLVQVTAVLVALDAALAREAALPPAATDAERLERMGAIDQPFRLQMHKMPLAGLSTDRVSAADSSRPRVLRHDAHPPEEPTARVKRRFPVA